MSTESDPPSPVSWVSDSEESVVSVSTTTTTNSKKRCSSHFESEHRPSFQTFVNKKPKFATKYDEMLQPLSPMTMLPIESLSLPTDSLVHRNSFNSQLQKEFRQLIESSATLLAVESFLEQHSETIDINEYNTEGRTALQQCVFEGNLPTVKLLVKYGADAKLTTRDGFSPLHLASFSGHSNILMYIISLRR